MGLSPELNQTVIILKTQLECLEAWILFWKKQINSWKNESKDVTTGFFMVRPSLNGGKVSEN